MNLKSAHTGKVGKAFINARNLRSISQEEAANLTLINIEYIKAIESGDYSIFPARIFACLLYTSPSPRDATLSRMPSSA